MKVISMNLNAAVLKGSKQDAIKCLRESFGVLEAANKMVVSLKAEAVTEEQKAMQLINAEELLEKLQTVGIDLYHDGSLSKVPALYDRLTVFQEIRNQLVRILDQVVDAYVDLTDEEQEAILLLSRKILEQLSFFVFYEFSFDVTSTRIQEGQEMEVNEVVLDYIGKDGLDLDQKVLFMLELYRRYRPIIPSFDFSEEEIDMFYYYTGVVAFTILDNIDAIEPDIVHKLAAGEISPEEVIASLVPHKEAGKMDLF